MGAAAWGAFPQGTNLQLVQGSTPGVAGSNDPHERLLWLADRACDILLLGQNLSSEINGQGSRAAAEVHREVELDLYETYAEFIVSILNEQLIPALIRQNWGRLEELPFVEVEIPRPPRDEEMTRRDKVLFQEMGLPVSLQYLYERHRVPSPDPGGALFQCDKSQARAENNLPVAPTTASFASNPHSEIRNPKSPCLCCHPLDAKSEGTGQLAARQQAAIAAFRSNSLKPKPPATTSFGLQSSTTAPPTFAASATAAAGATAGHCRRRSISLAVAPSSASPRAPTSHRRYGSRERQRVVPHAGSTNSPGSRCPSQIRSTSTSRSDSFTR